MEDIANTADVEKIRKYQSATPGDKFTASQVLIANPRHWDQMSWKETEVIGFKKGKLKKVNNHISRKMIQGNQVWQESYQKSKILARVEEKIYWPEAQHRNWESKDEQSKGSRINFSIQEKHNNWMYHHEVQRADIKSRGIDRHFNKIVSENVTN